MVINREMDILPADVVGVDLSVAGDPMARLAEAG